MRKKNLLPTATCSAVGSLVYKTQQPPPTLRGINGGKFSRIGFLPKITLTHFVHSLTGFLPDVSGQATPLEMTAISALG